MQILVERGCGLDVHQATVVACLLLVGKDGRVHTSRCGPLARPRESR